MKDHCSLGDSSLRSKSSQDTIERNKNVRLLKQLPIPQPRYDLRLVGCREFETLSDTKREDRQRVSRQYNNMRKGKLPDYAYALACFLEGLDSSAIKGSLASAQNMHRFRVRLCGELLRMFERYEDNQIASVTLVNPAHSYTRQQLGSVNLETLKKQTRDQLDRAGVTQARGLLFGVLEGEYCAGRFQLHYHFIAAGDKIGAFEELRNTRCFRPTAQVKKPLMVKRISYRYGYFPYCLKLFWKAKRRFQDVETGKIKKTKQSFRAPVMAEAAYLQLLHTVSLTNLMILQNMRLGKGGLREINCAVDNSIPSLGAQ